MPANDLAIPECRRDKRTCRVSLLRGQQVGSYPETGLWEACQIGIDKSASRQNCSSEGLLNGSSHARFPVLIQIVVGRRFR